MTGLINLATLYLHSIRGLCLSQMDAIDIGNAFLCDCHCGLKLTWALWVIFWWDACQCVTLDWLLGAARPGIDGMFEARINCKLRFISLTFSTYRWSKTSPERNHFPAGINPSLPQATHPQGTTCVYGSDSLTLWTCGDCQSSAVPSCVFEGIVL